MSNRKRHFERAASSLHAQDRQWAALRARLGETDSDGQFRPPASDGPLEIVYIVRAVTQLCPFPSRPSVSDANP